ncbi:MAG TPA: protein kinase [Kofleriaceae bacterium]|nr:protein kinase [Kofleriaceae bacterium]
MSIPVPIYVRPGTAPVLAIGPGAMLGRYQVQSHLASGGMAEIYLARAIGLEGFERYVVVKCIKPEHARDDRFVKMFIDEARVSAHLHHQNIAQVYDIGQEGGAYYFAMEYLHGENARDLLHKVAVARGEVPLEHALTIVCGAAAGLHYAHEKRVGEGQHLGIVHRDVSPSNIVVTFDGAVKVVDFGIAKAATRMTETQSGNLKGKIAYMSPEQCRGGALDRRSDVFALGIVLYELTTVTRLFRGASDYMMMNKIVNGEIDRPSARRAGYPPELEAIVMRALANKAEDRFASAAEMRDALVTFAKGAGVPLSTIGLERYVRDLFGERPEPWANTPTPTPASEPTPMPGPPAYVPSGTVTSHGSLAMSAVAVPATPRARSTRSAIVLSGAVLLSGALISAALVFDQWRSTGTRAERAVGPVLQPVTEPETQPEPEPQSQPEPQPQRQPQPPSVAAPTLEIDAGVAPMPVPAPAPDVTPEPEPASSSSRSSRSRRSRAPSPSSSPSSVPAPASSAAPSTTPQAPDAGASLRDPKRLLPED